MFLLIGLGGQIQEEAQFPQGSPNTSPIQNGLWGKSTSKGLFKDIGCVENFQENKKGNARKQ